LNKKLFSNAECIEEANKKRDFSFYESVLKKQRAGNQSFPENREECDVDEPQVIVEFDPNQPSTSSSGQGIPLSSATLEDPQGSTSKKSKTSPFNITPIPKIKRGSRIGDERPAVLWSSHLRLIKPSWWKLKKTKEVKKAEQQAWNRAHGCKSNRYQGRSSAV
ncbi:hypothetical protein ANN_06876, partial [Periplaneta americana]